jgi:parvulin-like peptidyl-prolyl isomerase
MMNKHFIRTRRILPAVISVFLLLGGCTNSDETKKTGLDTGSKRVVVKVNGDPVTEGDVARHIRAIYGSVDKSKTDPTRWQMMFEAATESEILDRLLLKEAISEGLEISSEDVGIALNRSRELLGEEKFKEMLKERNSSEQEYGEFLKQRMLIRKYKAKLFEDITIEDETLRVYYEGHKENFSVSEGVRLEMIVVDNPDDAEEIYKRVEKGEDFEKLVKEYSEKYKKKVGGKMRWMPYEAIPSDIQPLVKSGKIGAVLEPVQSDDGIRIIRILDKRQAGPLTYEEARENIRDFFLRKREQEILDNWFTAVKQKSTVEYVR